MAIIETIAVGSIFKWIWDTYGKEITDSTLKKAWERVRWVDAEQKYLNNVVKDYGTTRFLGKPKPVKLTNIFTHVQILDRPRAMRFYSKEQLLEQFAERRFTGFGADDERLSGIEALKRHDRLFILGKPGAGKTTFLKYVAIESAQGRGVGKVPIFVGLKQLADSGEELLDFIAGEFGICGFPDALPFVKKLLKSGKAIVLFDGLDEVNLEGNQRAILSTVLNEFAREYDASQCVVTCRIAATDYVFPHFTYTEMADFDREQQRLFIGNWFLEDATKRETCWSALDQAENKDLREMAQVPLLLGLLCLGFEETGVFPDRRVEIYEEALDALLKKWDSSRNIQRDQVYKQLSLGRKRQLLARIAAEAFQSGDYFLDQRLLEKQIVAYLARVPGIGDEVDIDGEAVIKAIEAQHGVLVERARRIHSFSHLTFQEYFTARYIVDNVGKGTLHRLLREVTDNRWREVFLLTASMLDDADQFFELFGQQLDSMIASETAIKALLAWANAEREAHEALAAYRPPALRAWLFDLALTSARASALALASASALALDRARARARASASALDLALASALDLDLDLDLDLARARDLDLASASASASASALRLDELAAALDDLEVPGFDASDAVWQQYVKALEAVIRQHRPIAFELRRIEQEIWQRDDISQLNFDQWEKMADYLNATNLLVDCLKLAVVTDRTAIEDRLLLPPS